MIKDTSIEVDPQRVSYKATQGPPEGADHCLVEARGDWLWQRDFWRLTANWQARELCHQCVASTGGPHTHPGSSKRWSSARLASVLWPLKV